MRPYLIPVIAFIGLVALLSYGSSRLTEAPSEGVYSSDPGEIRKSFEIAIEQKRPRSAYEAIVSEYAGAGFDLQHNVAHIVGEELYDAESIDGIRFCDPSFSFGCYHGFFTRAVASEGLSIVSFLDEACGAMTEGEPSACRHGIGHGILEYLGAEHLSEALRACLKTTQPGPLVGCTSGVFMEYNVPLRYLEEGGFSTMPRALNPENPYEPCDLIPYEFQQSCYHELPQWWAQVFQHDYEHLGVLCDALEDEASEACFLGIGKIVAPSMQFDPEKTRAACQYMPDERGEYFCASAASWSIARDGGGIEASKTVCRKSRPEYNRSCPADSP